MNRIMIDIETLSQRKDALILSIGAVKFSKDGIDPKVFYEELSLNSQKCRHIDAGTVQFWLEQSIDMPHGKIDLCVALFEFERWAGTIDEIWANSPSFDCDIMADAYKSYSLQVPWSYRAERCVRTMRAMYPTARVNTQKHNALADAEYQAHCVIDGLQKL